ncbi:aminotransferase class III-fold pyridoxal phosphate-dependent enzyme [Bradyrhizobium sp. JR3.5]
MSAQHIADLRTDPANEAALDRRLAEVASIIVEPRIECAGGMLFHDYEVLRCLRRLADKHDLLLIFDEIFVGLGRTGDLFASARARSPTSSRSPRRSWAGRCLCRRRLRGDACSTATGSMFRRQP